MNEFLLLRLSGTYNARAVSITVIGCTLRYDITSIKAINAYWSITPVSIHNIHLTQQSNARFHQPLPPLSAPYLLSRFTVTLRTSCRTMFAFSAE